MGILNDLVSMSEELASQARERVWKQRRALELLELRGNAEAVRRAQMVLLTLEQAYRIALYRLRADRAVAGEAISGD
jgi:hypothetical protein